MYLFFYPILKSQFWNDFNVHTYQARCLNNGKLVVFYGTVDNSVYEFKGKLITNSYLEKRNDLKFYCNNYDEIQKYIDKYKKAKNIEEQEKVNAEYKNFEKTALNANKLNYTIKVVNTKTDFTKFFTGIRIGLIYSLIYYLVLQIIRIIFQYILFKKILWNPY